MDTLEFFEQVWPATGFYCLATPATKGWRHYVFESPGQAASWAKQSQVDTFFAVFTLRQPKYFNPHKPDRKTGEMGRYEVRSHPNMYETRVFFCDVDVGPQEDKYPDQRAAVAGLKKFCTAVGFPAPTIASSGRGIHVYWPMDKALSAERWKPYAFKLHRLIRHHGLLVDHSKVTDQSTVLRVPGTRHLKDPSNPREVKVLMKGKVTEQETLLKMIDDAEIRAGLTPQTTPLFNGGPPGEDLLGTNLEKDYGPPPKLRSLLKACPQLLKIANAKGCVSEPIWYHGYIGVMQFVEDGREWVHRLSSGYEHYSRDETEAKLDQWPGGVSSCAKIAEKCGEILCVNCPFAKENRNPIWAARQLDLAPSPQVTLSFAGIETTCSPPDPPGPYKRLSDGSIGIVAKDKEGDIRHITLLNHDFFPLRREANREDEVEATTWRAMLPRGEIRDFSVTASDLCSQQELMKRLANNGVYVQADQSKQMQAYMVAYVKKLQQEADAATQMTHLGWVDDGTKFVLPDRVIQEDGSLKPATLSMQAHQIGQFFGQKGDPQRQIELLKFYNSPAYVANQFYILCGLGAPLFGFSDQNGIVINAQGEPGASKSTTLYTAASLWGDPKLSTMNGTVTGATNLAKQNRATVLANLPLCVDEITHMPAATAKAMAMDATQPGGRIRLDRRGVEKKSISISKASIMLTTANSSLHGLLSSDNTAGTAGSMRVFEMKFRLAGIHTKAQADNYMHELLQNWGHIGPAFMTWTVPNRMEVHTRFWELMRLIDKLGDIQPSERFWSAGAATAVTTAEYSKKLGLLFYDPEYLLNWIVKDQLPLMRNVVREEYSNPVSILADFIDKHNGQTVIMNKDDYPIHEPRGELVAHYSQKDMWIQISKTAFKNYCLKIGASPISVINELTQQRVVVKPRFKATLGKGTPFAKTQTWVFQVDLTHPELDAKLGDIEQTNSLLSKTLAKVR